MDVSELVGKSILTHNSETGDLIKVSSQNVLRAEFLGLYFSASYCPPCREFTPLLQRFFEDVNSQYNIIDIVFCSKDRTEADFIDYFTNHHIWHAIPYQKDKLRTDLMAAFHVQTIPKLIIIDTQTGEVVSDTARQDIPKMSAGAVLNKWFENQAI